MRATSLSSHPQLGDRTLREAFAKACGAPRSAAALPSSSPAFGGAAVPRDRAGRGGMDGGHMLMAKEKPRELYGNSDVAVVFRRGL